MKQLTLEQYNLIQRDITVSNKGVITFPADLYKDIMLITASCGRGKTYYSFNALLDDINTILMRNAICHVHKDIEKEEVLFLTSRKIIKKQQLKGGNAAIQATSGMYDTNMLEWDKEEYKGKIQVTTMHQWGEWVKKGLIKKHPKVVIIDEIQSLFSENVFAESLLYTIEYLKENWNELIKIGLTATPQYLYNYVSEVDNTITFKRIDKELGSRYKANKVTIYMNKTLDSVKKEYEVKANEEYKILEYTMSATRCYNMADERDNAAFMISEYNDNKPKDKEVTLSTLMKQQEKDGVNVKNYITDNCKLPFGIDILYINSACREGMNLKDEKVKTVICEAVDMITIEQILGRIRGDLEEFVVVCNFNYLTMVDKQIKEIAKSISDSPTQIELARIYGQQEKDKNMSKVVYYYNDEYKINVYGIAYLKYMKESYIQLQNNSNDRVVRVGVRDMLLCDEYLAQLSKYAVNGTINIQKAILDKNHENVIERFKQIENEWLNKPIGKEEKKELCAALECKRDKGQPAKWNTIKQILADNGYSVVDKSLRVGGKVTRVSIIKC